MSSSLYRLPLALFASLLALQAQAKDPQYSAAYSRCMDNSGGVTSSMVQCSGAEFDRQDARLNLNYKAAMGNLQEPQKTLLRDAQRAWIKYRDSNCDLYARLTGGTIDRINSSSCMLEATAQRADELDNIGNL